MTDNSDCNCQQALDLIDHLERVRRALNPTTEDDAKPLTRETLAGLVIEVAKLRRDREELEQWRSMFASPDVARSTFVKIREAVDAALGESEALRGMVGSEVIE